MQWQNTFFWLLNEDGSSTDVVLGCCVATVYIFCQYPHPASFELRICK